MLTVEGFHLAQRMMVEWRRGERRSVVHTVLRRMLEVAGTYPETQVRATPALPPPSRATRPRRPPGTVPPGVDLRHLRALLDRRRRANHRARGDASRPYSTRPLASAARNGARARLHPARTLGARRGADARGNFPHQRHPGVARRGRAPATRSDACQARQRRTMRHRRGGHRGVERAAGARHRPVRCHATLPSRWSSRK